MSDKTAEELRNELTEMTITAGEWREKCEGLEETLRKGIAIPICHAGEDMPGEDVPR